MAYLAASEGPRGRLCECLGMAEDRLLSVSCLPTMPAMHVKQMLKHVCLCGGLYTCLFAFLCACLILYACLSICMNAIMDAHLCL